MGTAGLDATRRRSTVGGPTSCVRQGTTGISDRAGAALRVFATCCSSRNIGPMARTIAQRVLRNDARMIEVVAAGEAFVVTRNGEPVPESSPIRTARRTFVPVTEGPALAATGPRIRQQRFRAELDRVADQCLKMATGRRDTSVVVDRDDPTVVASLPEAVYRRSTHRRHRHRPRRRATALQPEP